MHSRTFSSRLLLCHIICLSLVALWKFRPANSHRRDFSGAYLRLLYSIVKWRQKNKIYNFFKLSCILFFSFTFLNLCNPLGSLRSLSFSLSTGPHQQSVVCSAFVFPVLKDNSPHISYLKAFFTSISVLK